MIKLWLIKKVAKIPKGIKLEFPIDTLSRKDHLQCMLLLLLLFRWMQQSDVGMT